MDLGLKGRRALVAAASKGLGRACAESLAGEGARVAICARDADEVRMAAEEIGASTGAEVAGIAVDLSTEDGAVGFVRQAADLLGGCEILVANVGGPPPARFENLTDDDFQEAFEGLFLSAVRMTREALPRMRAAGYGRVVVIGSSAMKQPIPNLMLSNAIRAGVAGWARTLADEVAGERITVNVVLPGRILTDRMRALGASAEGIPLERAGEPRDVGDLVAYLASERAAYLTGCFIPVDGGMYRGLF